MVHCRSPTKCLKNGHFPSNQIQIVPDSNCCKLFMDNGLPAGANFSPDTSESLRLDARRAGPERPSFEPPAAGPKKIVQKGKTGVIGASSSSFLQLSVPSQRSRGMGPALL